MKEIKIEKHKGAFYFSIPMSPSYRMKCFYCGLGLSTDYVKIMDDLRKSSLLTEDFKPSCCACFDIKHLFGSNYCRRCRNILDINYFSFCRALVYCNICGFEKVVVRK